MSTRTVLSSVKFNRPFALSSVEGVQPAGTYQVETDEEQIEGLSFDAFRRTTTFLYLPADPPRGVVRHVVQVDPRELAAALAADGP
jgi:hypothetical protein